MEAKKEKETDKDVERSKGVDRKDYYVSLFQVSVFRVFKKSLRINPLCCLVAFCPLGKAAGRERIWQTAPSSLLRGFFCLMSLHILC